MTIFFVTHECRNGLSRPRVLVLVPALHDNRAMIPP